MIVLGIETSCDETGVAILKAKNSKIKVLANLLVSQAKLHSKYGGVFPALAKREHQKNLPILFERAQKLAQNPKIDLISVVVGPGLEPCLWQGINFAKGLAKNFRVPLFPVNHLEAHILINFLPSNLQPLTSNIFPAVCLLVSGGHTQLVLMKDIGKYQLLGETRDDAAGECFDKVARLLKLGYPGGPEIEKLAKAKLKTPRFHIKLPRPMLFQKNFDFSFAGLKTAVLYDFLKRKPKERNSQQYKIEMAKELQRAAFDVLFFKTKRAVETFGAKSVIFGGGVMANEFLRKKFKKNLKKFFPQLKIFIPKKEHCTDNGLMVAFCAYLNYLKKGKPVSAKIKASPDLKI